MLVASVRLRQIFNLGCENFINKNELLPLHSLALAVKAGLPFLEHHLSSKKKMKTLIRVKDGWNRHN